MTLEPHTPAGGFPGSLVAAALDAALSLPQATPVLALSGLQGSGKSTLANAIERMAVSRGKRVAVLSLDDFYLPGSVRQALARDVHPLLATRGPPGTHDVGQALEVLQRLREGQPVRLPRFDKLHDEPEPVADWPMATGRLDLVLLEGWCVGVPAQAEAEMETPINALERDQDPRGIWRRWCNAALARDYPALWARCDALWLLQAPGFECIPEWRWQQECALRQVRGRAAMDRAAVDRFVQLFERVSRQALRRLPAIASRVVALDAQRRPA